jgi:transcriptional regulator with XRE-family HTH domain
MTANPGEPQTTAPDTPRRGRVPADTFSVRLLLSRHLAGLSIKEAAERAGLNDATWATWEAGRRPRDVVEVAQRVALACDVDFNWLLLGGQLDSPMGRPVNRAAKGRGVNTTWYAPPSAVPAGAAGRPTTSRPKGRADTTHPTGHSGGSRRPVRVNPVHPGEVINAA